MSNNAIPGSALQLYVNGKLLGQVSHVSFQSSVAHTPKMGIDSLLPVELVPTATRVTGTIQLYRMTGDGGAEGIGLTAAFEHIHRAKYSTLQLVHRLYNLTVFQSEYTVISNQQWDAPARGVMRGSVSFEAIVWSNEAPRVAM